MPKFTKAVFKFNGGEGALLCSHCSRIIKTGKDFTEEEHKAMKGELNLPIQYCDKCSEFIYKIKTIWFNRGIRAAQENMINELKPKKHG